MGLAVLGCALAILGARLDYIGRFASDLPNWDQWYSEGTELLVPYMRGELSIADFLEPNNEHRVVPTKLLALGLFAANGQWDARLECVTNALMQAVLAAGIMVFGLRMVAPSLRAVWLLGVVALTAPAFAWHNATSGYHTQQTFLIGFSLLAIHLLLSRRELSPGWWAGLGSALAACLSMGSGALASMAIGVTVVLVTPVRELPRRRAFTLAGCTGMVLLGMALLRHVPHHDVLQAQSIADFLLAFWRSLQWPQTTLVFFPLLAWSPFVWLAWRVIRTPDLSELHERVLLSVGLWVLLQYAASAYARGAGGDWPAIRYLDTVVLGLAANLLALLRAFSVRSPQGIAARSRIIWAAACFITLGHGWWQRFDEIRHGVGDWLAASFTEKEARTRRYLATGDESILQTGEIPFPSASILAGYLGIPEVRAILPASVRAPLDAGFLGQTGSDFRSDGFAPHAPPPAGWPVLGSYRSTQEPAHMVWRSPLLSPGRASHWVVPVHISEAGSPWLTVTLVDAENRHLLSLAPGATEWWRGTDWKEIVLPAPSVPAHLLMRDDADAGWMAVGAPAEMGWLSTIAWRMSRSGTTVFWVGICFALTGTILDLRRFRYTIGDTCATRPRERAPRRWQATAFVAAGLASAGTTWIADRCTRRPALFEMAVAGDLPGHSMELFFDRGRGIRGEDAVQAWFDGPDTVRTLRLQLPAGRFQKFRLDPIDHGGRVRVSQVRITDDRGETLRLVPPAAFSPHAQVASFHSDEAGIAVQSEAVADDSQVLIQLENPVETYPVRLHSWRGLILVMAAALGAFGGFASVVAVSVRVFRRSCRRGENT